MFHLFGRGRTWWTKRRAGEECPLGGQPDWMRVPKLTADMDGGPRKRRVLRQYTSPCPMTGKPVVTRELEGGVYCWENPELPQGWVLAFRPDASRETCEVVDGDAYDGEGVAND